MNCLSRATVPKETLTMEKKKKREKIDDIRGPVASLPVQLEQHPTAMLMLLPIILHNFYTSMKSSKHSGNTTMLNIDAGYGRKKPTRLILPEDKAIRNLSFINSYDQVSVKYQVYQSLR